MDWGEGQAQLSLHSWASPGDAQHLAMCDSRWAGTFLQQLCSTSSRDELRDVPGLGLHRGQKGRALWPLLGLEWTNMYKKRGSLIAAGQGGGTEGI